MRTRRMISDEIVESDDFLALSNNAQLLYFHLIMNADNRGYINKARRTINSIIGVEKGDLDELVAKKFILKRGENLYLIKGWYIHNDIPTYVSEETNYLDDLKKLCFDENFAYTERKTDKSVAENIREKKYKNKSKENKKENQNQNENEKETKIKNKNKYNNELVDIDNIPDDAKF